ncbi:CAP domain-containing protein [Parvibaculum sp.]|jgi:uncharacterized protein YkwD|uniref:CAP domain-containing protein n=1 Tax=Parvibaculum sp. TaxID=2024848 RepID=UPI000C47E7E1|nr:CAP domain-containing protein [Parvibaculum sp.]MAM95773.1 hypothetical protein [Parvibaculum sp.]|tara:strand:+ start:10238 stop:10807 length:570 start_codon:yes stop_codon:yes gene_type:complete
MKMNRIAAAGFAFLALAFLTGCTTQGSGTPQNPKEINITTLPAEASAAAQSHPGLSAAILQAVNAYRAEKGLGQLAADANLQRIAAVHAADMQLRGFFGHFNPDGQGPRERMMAVNPCFTGRIAENIEVVEGPSHAAMNDTELANSLVKKWIESPMHRKNIKAPEMTKSGVGIARQGNRIIAAQVFGSR